VSIIIGVKKKDGGKGLAEVMHGDLWGARAVKYEALEGAGLSGSIFKPLESPAPQHPFVKRDFSVYADYSKGFLISEFFPLHGNGIVTKRDRLNVHHSTDGVTTMARDFANMGENDFRTKYRLPKDVRDWRYEWAKQDVLNQGDRIPVVEIGYRLFDRRFLFWSGRARGVVGWPVSQVMDHYRRGENVGLLSSKAHLDASFAHSFVTDKPTEAIHFSATTGSNAMNFPLYLYPDEQDLDQTRRVNFDRKLYKRLQEMAAHPDKGTPDEIAAFDYIYGVLHCPAYRETYAEFLKIGFPRIPWPTTPDEFWDVSAKGTQLRKLHLMDPAAIGQTPYPFTGEGDNMVEKTNFADGKIWINNTQYFADAPEVSWGFYIGGYQPAQKWLKDRKGRALSFDDVKHYQRILKILSETDRIMQTIEMDLK